MNSPTYKFIYSPSVSSFLSEIVDRESRYVDATKQLEFFVTRDVNIGDAIDRPPLVFRRFVVRLLGLKELAFYYIYNIRDGIHEVGVVKVEFAEKTPI